MQSSISFWRLQTNLRIMNQLPYPLLSFSYLPRRCLRKHQEVPLKRDSLWLASYYDDHHGTPALLLLCLSRFPCLLRRFLRLLRAREITTLNQFMVQQREACRLTFGFAQKFATFTSMQAGVVPPFEQTQNCTVRSGGNGLATRNVVQPFHRGMGSEIRATGEPSHSTVAKKLCIARKASALPFPPEENKGWTEAVISNRSPQIVSTEIEDSN